ncbi:hypothetical protein BHM03_00047104 [Ensete ventricosum]|nr:hypothetical protein BHM03_00047104 [Ensete ventricosum]
MVPSCDHASSALLCAEDNSCILSFDDEDDGDCEEEREHKRRNFYGDPLTNIPPKSQECLVSLVERESEHMPREDYAERLRSGALDSSIRTDAIDRILKVAPWADFLAFRPSEIAAATTLLVSGERQPVDVDKAVSCCLQVAKGPEQRRMPRPYCSSLYPKFERYSTCNWCLSEDGVKSAAQESTMDQHRSLSFSSNSTGRGLTVKLHGGASSQHLKKVLNKPVKKLQTHAHERLQLPALSKTTRLDLPLPSLRKQKQAFRCRARKFKLLEEVLTQTEQNTPNHYVMCMRSSCKQKPQTLFMLSSG